MIWKFPGLHWLGICMLRGLQYRKKAGKPESFAIPSPGDDQLLVRVDAVGLCFSDVKLIKLGGDHPKLYGRDLSKEPTRLGMRWL